MNLPHAVAGGNVNGSIPTNFSLAMTEVRNTKAFRAGKHINHEILQSSGSRTQIYWLPKIPELNICGCYHQSKPDNDQHNCSWSTLPVASLGATPQHLPWLQDKEHFLGKLDVQSQAHPGLELDLSLNLHQMTLEFLLGSKRIGNPLP